MSELYHYGVKGMKWGRRKKTESSSNSSTKNSVNKDYTDKQRKRDRAFYGARGEKRINKRLNEGHGIQGARHYEVERQRRKEKTKKIVKKGAKVAAGILTTTGSLLIVDQIKTGGEGRRAVEKMIKSAGRTVVSTFHKQKDIY